MSETKDPIGQIQEWLNDAEKAEISNHNAMCLATVDQDNNPSNRFVLLKDINERGLVFYTNYESNKSKDMMDNENVATTLWWDKLNKSVRVKGKVWRISDEENDQYY